MALTSQQTDPRIIGWRKLIAMCFIAFALVAISSSFDQLVAEWVNSLQIRTTMKSWPVVAIKTIGVFWTTVAIAVLITFFHRYHWRAGLFMLMTGLVALLGNLLKWTIGRTRPFKLEPYTHQAFPFTLQPFRDSFSGLLEQKNLAFPSGHAMVAFAAAAALAILLPRWWIVFYLAAALVAAERVMENAHWLSDTVGAAGLAICGVHLMWRIIAPWVTAQPTIKSEPQTATKIESI